MKIQYSLNSTLILAMAVLLLATCADAAPKKKQHFELFVPVIASQSIKSNQYCGSLSGALSSGEFFGGLERLGAGRHIEFRKDAQPVKEFPSNIAVALAGNIAPCAPEPNSAVNFVQPGNGSSQQTVSEFMNGLRFTALWKSPRGEQPVPNWSITKSVSDDKAWRVNDQIPVRFAFEVPSQGVPLTNQLVISVYAPDGVKLVAFTAGVLSHLPKHHLKTIHGRQGE